MYTPLVRVVACPQLFLAGITPVLRPMPLPGDEITGFSRKSGDRRCFHGLPGSHFPLTLAGLCLYGQIVNGIYNVQPDAGNDPAGGGGEDPVARRGISGSGRHRPPPVGKDDARPIGIPAIALCPTGGSGHPGLCRRGPAQFSCTLRKDRSGSRRGAESPGALLVPPGHP